MGFVEGMTWAAIGMLLWHLALWPALLARLAPSHAPRPARIDDAALPELAILVPAHDEAGTIAAKIANVAALDYPADRLRLILVLDGCTDDTEARATALLAGPMAHLDAQIIHFDRNRGKVAALNAGFAAVGGRGIVIVTDCSAELAPDAARRLAAAFADPALGAIGAGYAVPEGGSLREDRFWRQQGALKAAEARLAAPMGLHGACYAVRAALVAPLPPDTINDDFALPMRLVLQGHRVAYDPSILVVEREGSDLGLDFRRRRRIGAGNLQQSLRHLGLADPRRPLLALVFLSGKGARPLVGPLMVLALFGSVALAVQGPAAFGLLALLQLAAYGGLLLATFVPPLRRLPGVGPLHHLVSAQLASGLGALAYLAGRHGGPWARVRPTDRIGA